MSDLPTPLASVVITSRNRKDDLLLAIDSCLRQSVPVEVLVFDDASTDGTPDAIRHAFPPDKFPQVRFFREEKPVGYIVLRNHGAQLAQCNIIFSIDDDAIFTTPAVVQQTLRDFEHPRVGAVAIPFKNIRLSDKLLQRAPDDLQVYATAKYFGTAHALRRDLFLELRGYRECLVHQGEESDYSIRLLDAGYIVRLGRSDLIHHFDSPKRDMTRLHYYGARNNILFAWYNIGLSRLPFILAGTTAKTLWHGLRNKAFRIKARAILCAYGEAFRTCGQRRPVSTAALVLFRKLRSTPLPITSIMNRLPPAQPLFQEPHP